MTSRFAPLACALASMLVCACSQTGSISTGQASDGAAIATSTDLAIASRDLLMAPPDLSPPAPDLLPPPGACSNPADLAILKAKQSQMQGILYDCAQSNSGSEPATRDCVKQMTGLSDGCTTCFDDGIACALKHCFNPCLQDSTGSKCVQCRKANCDPAFVKCSGVNIP